MLNTAVKAARRAGQIILRYAPQLERLAVETKGRNDFVSEVDHMAEQEIIAILHRAYPDHGILAEESGAHTLNESGDEYRWVIDPLDGTTNFLHGYPQYAVSIALQHKGKLDQAVIFDPLRDELFTASRGTGAQLNDRRIRVSGLRKFETALLGTGFPFKAQDYLDIWIETFRPMITQSAGVRRAGSAALDLAHVACGRLDGFWEFELKPWDMAAGALLVEEAGGMISGISGRQDYLETGHVLAAAPKIHEHMLAVLKPLLPPDLLP